MVSLLTSSVSHTSSAEILQLRAQVEQQLKSNAITPLRHVVCETHGQVIVLRGQVESFYQKQLAQEAVKQLASKALILNLLAVQ